MSPTYKISELQKDKERYYYLIQRHFVFLDRELECKAETELGVGKIEEWETQKAALLESRFSVAPLCKFKSHFVSIDSRIHGIMQEISPELDFSGEEFSGENRDTYWNNTFDSQRLKTSKKKVFTGLIETDRVAMCGHHRRLKTDRPVPPLAKGEDEKEEHPTAQEVEITILSLARRSRKKRRWRVLRRRRWRITTFSLARTPATRISVPPLLPSVRKMVLTVTCFRKTCVC